MKLAAINTEEWSLKLLGDQGNFNAILDELAVRFEEPQSAAPGGVPVNNDSFSYWSKRVRWMQHAFRTRPDSAMPQNGREAERHLKPPHDTGQRTPPEDIFSSDLFNLDENFWYFAGDIDLGKCLSIPY